MLAWRIASVLVVAAAVAAIQPPMADDARGSASAAATSKRSRGHGWQARRSDRRPTEEQRDELSMTKLKGKVRSLTEQLRSMLLPVTPAGGFNMSADESARKSMIDWLWAGDYNDSVTEMSSANPDLHTRLVSNTRNSSYTPSPSQVWRSERRLNFLTGLLTRNRNVNVIPKDQVLLAIQAKVRKCLTLPCPRLVPASCVQCVLLTAACSVVVACSTKTPTRNFGKT
jgi:hypothetical protein